MSLSEYVSVTDYLFFFVYQFKCFIDAHRANGLTIASLGFTLESKWCCFAVIELGLSSGKGELSFIKDLLNIAFLDLHSKFTFFAELNLVCNTIVFRWVTVYISCCVICILNRIHNSRWIHLSLYNYFILILIEILC